MLMLEKLNTVNRRLSTTSAVPKLRLADPANNTRLQIAESETLRRSSVRSPYCLLLSIRLIQFQCRRQVTLREYTDSLKTKRMPPAATVIGVVSSQFLNSARLSIGKWKF
jgi:hypothetical protein